jgi:hypothetical protein
MARTLQKQLIRVQAQTFADWCADVALASRTSALWRAITASPAAWSAPFKGSAARRARSWPDYIVTMAGYNAAFLTLAMMATAGLLLIVIVIAMAETTPSAEGSPS